MAKHNRRLSDLIRCPRCGSGNAYERCITDGVWDILCPTCFLIFDWDALPKECRGCKVKLRDAVELGRGLCPKCHLATYTPEQRASLNKLISMAFKKPPPPDKEVDAVIDETLKHLDTNPEG